MLENSELLVLAGPEPVCGGTFEALARRVHALQVLFGDSPKKVHYYWMPQGLAGTPCPKGATGCADGDIIYAERVPHEHELVHAARADVLPGVLEEGLATLLGEYAGPPVSRDELLQVIQGREEMRTGSQYERAAHFVAFLLGRGGFGALRRLEQDTSRSMPFEDWAPLVEDVYDDSWEGLWAAYLAYPECDARTMHEDVLLCHGAEQPIAQLTPDFGDPKTLVIDMDCAAQDVTGPFSDELIYEALVEIGIPESPYFWVQLTGDVVAGSRATLSRCGSSCADEAGLSVSAEEPVLPLDVQPGLYVLELRQPIEVGGQLGIRTSY